MHPTKRQIASVIRKAARALPDYPRMTNALFEVCKARGSRASIYYDAAANTVKIFTGESFTKLLRLPAPTLQRTMRQAARALEHGLALQ